MVQRNDLSQLTAELNHVSGVFLFSFDTESTATGVSPKTDLNESKLINNRHRLV